MGDDLVFTTICQRDPQKQITAPLNMTQEEFEQIVKQHDTGKRSQQVYRQFSIEDAKKLVRDGENLIGKGSVDTDGFNEAIGFFMSLTEQIWRITQKHQSFRMELYYDAETLKTNYCFFAPIDKHVSDGTSPGFSES